jgi:hypothetical protein
MPCIECGRYTNDKELCWECEGLIEEKEEDFDLIDILLKDENPED